MTQSPWVYIPKPNPQAARRLLCIPYEGGNAKVFRQWPIPSTMGLNREIEVCAIQLPGRDARSREAPFTSMPLLTEALAGALHPFLDKPFAIFGHGLGASIGFELTRHLRKTLQTRPLHLLVAGRRAPQMPNDSSPIYDLPDPEFIAAVRDLNTIPAEVLEHPELMDLMLPMLRADFELAETNVYRAEPPLDVPISAYGGEEDSRATREELERWQEQTIAGFNLRMFPGGHFFLHSAEARLLEAINRDLAATRARS